MKLSKSTLNILKNFATINPSLYLRKGNVITTKTINNVIYAEAYVEDMIDADLGIYSVAEFLSILGLFQSDFEIVADEGEETVHIADSRSKVNYALVDPSVIKYPAKIANFPVSDVQFQLSEEDLKRIKSASGSLRLPQIMFTNQDGRVVLKAVNPEDPSANDYALDIAEYDGTMDFSVYVDIQNMKMIDANYKVMISKLGAIRFEGEIASYIIAIDKRSTFQE